MNMSVKLEDITSKYGSDPTTQIIITRDCLTINGASQRGRHGLCRRRALRACRGVHRMPMRHPPLKQQHWWCRRTMGHRCGGNCTAWAWLPYPYVPCPARDPHACRARTPSQYGCHSLLLQLPPHLLLRRAVLACMPCLCPALLLCPGGALGLLLGALLVVPCRRMMPVLEALHTHSTCPAFTLPAFTQHLSCIVCWSAAQRCPS